MKIVLDKDKFEAIDSAFAKLKENRHDSGAIATIRRNLKAVFQDKDIDVTVIENKANLFIMSIFPDESAVQTIIDAIVNEKTDEMIRKAWQSTDKWHIEIDSRILTDQNISATSKELTALLLHEVGHIVYSNSIPQRISKVMRLEYARANIETKTALKDKLFNCILKLPILNACVFDNYKTKENIKKELKADVFVVKMGYGDELDSVLQKMLVASKDPKIKEVDQTPQQVYSDMKSVTMFSINTVEQLKKRKTALVKANLKKLMFNSPSKFVQKVISGIENAFVKGGEGAVTESVKAAYIAKKFDAITESIQNSYLDHPEFYMERFFTKKLSRIDPAMIAYVELEKDNIKTNDDKMMLVSYIFSKLDMIDYYISIIDSHNPKYVVPHSKAALLDMKKQLLRIKDDVMAYKIPEVNYNVYVGGYPIGYEG